MDQRLNYKDLERLFTKGQPRIYLLGFASKFNSWKYRDISSAVLVRLRNRLREFLTFDPYNLLLFIFYSIPVEATISTKYHSEWWGQNHNGSPLTLTAFSYLK